MKGLSIEERAIRVAEYLIETEDTVRGAPEGSAAAGKCR